MLPNLRIAYFLKFKKKPIKEVEMILLKLSAWYEIYIPYEESKFEYIVGAVYLDEEIKNWKNHLESIDKELLESTAEEMKLMKSLQGIECSYMRNVDHDFNNGTSN